MEDPLRLTSLARNPLVEISVALALLAEVEINLPLCSLVTLVSKLPKKA